MTETEKEASRSNANQRGGQRGLDLEQQTLRCTALSETWQCCDGRLYQCEGVDGCGWRLCHRRTKLQTRVVKRGGYALRQGGSSTARGRCAVRARKSVSGYISFHLATLAAWRLTRVKRSVASNRARGILNWSCVGKNRTRAMRVRAARILQSRACAGRSV